MKLSVYRSKSGFNCGPCSFINLIGIKGNSKVEASLARNGKLKLFKASTYTAFLIWAKKYGKEIVVYTSSKKMNNKMFKLMFKYEKIPKELQEKYKRLGLKRFNDLNKKFSSKIRKLGDPLKKLDSLLEEGYLVAVLLSSYYIGNDVPHWIVAFKKERNKYYFMDSAKRANKITVLSKKELLKSFKLNKKNGYSPVLIAHKR